MRQFTTRFFERGYRANDINGGLQWLAKQGYVEQKHAQGRQATRCSLQKPGFLLSSLLRTGGV